jgi:thiamine-phosphate pyrophosphorylase
MPAPHEKIETWTAGAQRVWAAARECALELAAAEVAVEHLLRALLSEENRAAEQLRRAGITLEAIPAEWMRGEGCEVKEGTANVETGTTLPQQEALRAVLIEARAEAFAQGPAVELGTEHLLIGLCRVSSAVSEWLAQFGVRGQPVSDASQKRSASTSSESTAPLSAEFRLRSQAPTNTDRVDVYRILDAAANRAREGLRVVEDFVRWAWNDGFLARELKELRHELADSLSRLPHAELLASRDSIGDVGAQIATASEYQRGSPATVATASLKRVEEALRSLEEFSKVIEANVARRFEQLRYRLYSIDKAVHATTRSRSRLADQRICLLATESLCHHGIGPAVLSALEAGVRMVQLREKSLPDRELMALARRLRDWANDFDALLIVNDRADIAAAIGADGVHLGQEDLPVSAARAIVGPDKLIGVSTHSLAQARQTVLDGADYLGVGPVFPSGTKTFAEYPGLALVREVAAEISLPWFVIGGITAENVRDVIAAGASRVAVSGAICSAEHPESAARMILSELNRMKNEVGESHSPT